MAILNLNFYLFVLIGQKIIVAGLKMGISPHGFVLYKYKSMQVFTGQQMGTTGSPCKMLVYERYIKNCVVWTGALRLKLLPSKNVQPSPFVYNRVDIGNHDPFDLYIKQMKMHKLLLIRDELKENSLPEDKAPQAPINSLTKWQTWRRLQSCKHNCQWNPPRIKMPFKKN